MTIELLGWPVGGFPGRESGTPIRPEADFASWLAGAVPAPAPMPAETGAGVPGAGGGATDGDTVRQLPELLPGRPDMECVPPVIAAGSPGREVLLELDRTGAPWTACEPDGLWSGEAGPAGETRVVFSVPWQLTAAGVLEGAVRLVAVGATAGGGSVLPLSGQGVQVGGGEPASRPSPGSLPMYSPELASVRTSAASAMPATVTLVRELPAASEAPKDPAMPLPPTAEPTAPWPQRLLWWAPSCNGASVWLRDFTIQPDGEASLADILRRQLRGDVPAIARIVINGRTVWSAPLPSPQDSQRENANAG